MQGTEARTTAHVIADRARAAVAGTLGEEAEADYTYLVEETLSSLLSKDFAAYERVMLKRGAALAPIVGPLAQDSFKSERYPADDVARLSNAAPREQAMYMWEHPEYRNADIVSVSVDEARFGTGWYLDGPWKKSGVGAQDSIWQPPEGRFFLIQKVSAGAAKSEWVEFPASFSSGERCKVRILFGYHPEAKVWYPVYIAVSSDVRKYFALPLI